MQVGGKAVSAAESAAQAMIYISGCLASHRYQRTTALAYRSVMTLLGDHTSANCVLYVIACAHM